MPTWLSIQNITFAIAVAGFLMSLATWIKDYISQRQNLTGRILGIKSYANVTYINLVLENRSRLPIAVTSIDLIYNQNVYTCTALPKRVSSLTERRNKEIVKYTEEFSTALPIQLQQLGASVALVLFERMDLLPPNDAKALNLVIHTNRGNPIQMTLELPEDWAAQRKFP